MEEKLLEMQNEVNKLYDEQGLTDEVLDKQIAVNALRNEHDLCDKTEQINGKYVQ